MNFDDINKIYKHMKTNVYPYSQTLWNDVSTEEVMIDKYLSIIDDNRVYKLIAVPFLMDTKSFLEKYKKKCILSYNTPDPQDGLMLFIHQISPTLHIHSRFFCWIENNVVYDYLACLVFHKNLNEALSFIDDNFGLAREGNTEENKEVGFKLGMSDDPPQSKGVGFGG